MSLSRPPLAVRILSRFDDGYLDHTDLPDPAFKAGRLQHEYLLSA